MQSKSIPFFVEDSGDLEFIKSALEKKEGFIKRLEGEFLDYVPSTYAISTLNSTAAFHLAFCAIDIKRGDKIICSVNAHPSIPETIRHFDAEPIFVDIDMDDFNIDPFKVEEVLIKNRSKKLRGVVVSHIAGQSANLKKIYEIAKEYKIKVIEDATYALGGTFKGEKIGSLEADATIFSFMPEKEGLIANGAMLLTKDSVIYERAMLLRFHSLTRNGGREDSYIYDVTDIGCRYDISELDAAFCYSVLKNSEKKIAHQKEIAKLYDAELKGVAHISTPIKKQDHIYSLYIVKVDKNRDGFARELKERGVEASLHFIPLHLLSYYKTKYNLKVNDFPNALRNYQQILSLPMHSKLTKDDALSVVKAVKDVSKGRV
jgi:dTDP-4-amino-4,6-dideoxygalactose transaminase